MNLRNKIKKLNTFKQMLTKLNSALDAGLSVSVGDSHNMNVFEMVQLKGIIEEHIKTMEESE